MRLRWTILAGTLGVAISITACGAQPAVQPGLTREQARQRADALFDRFDLNHDGIVTRAEAQLLGPKLILIRVETGRDPAPGLGGHTLYFLEQRFAGVDRVTKEQFEAAFLEHFDQMDEDHDGVLTAAERRSAH